MRRTHLKTIKYRSATHARFPTSSLATLLTHLMQLQVKLVVVIPCRGMRTTCTRHDVLRGLRPASCVEGNSVLGLRRFPTPSDSCHIDPGGPDLARDAQIFGKNGQQRPHTRDYTSGVRFALTSARKINVWEAPEGRAACHAHAFQGTG